MRWLKVLVFALCLVPLALLGWKAYQQDLSANPIEFITHWTGDWTLRFLVITLAITPLRKLLRWPELVKIRRMLGLFAFFYGCLHLTTYLWLDKFFAWGEIVKDIGKRPFITAGFAAFIVLVPLAVTSTAGWIRRLGRKALADAAPADLLQRHRGRGALLLAGEIGYPQAGILWSAGGDSAGLPRSRGAAANPEPRKLRTSGPHALPVELK